MDAKEVHREYEAILDAIGAESFLNELYQALMTDQAHDLFEHIARMNDIDL